MQYIFDFTAAALPWISIGLFIALFAVRERYKDDPSKESRFLKSLYFAPSGCFFVASMLEINESKSRSAAYLVLAIVFLMLSFGDAQKKKKEK